VSSTTSNQQKDSPANAPAAVVVPLRLTMRSTTIDPAIYRMVVVENEYRLPPRFESGDLILDIGAHIGFFALAVLARGAGRVVCVEADRENYEIARTNLAGFIEAGRVGLLHGAAWRSDDNEDTLYHAGYPRLRGGLLNTGGGSIHTAGGGEPTPKIPFDEIIDEETRKSGARVRLLKLDCEGSEFPILSTSSRLHLIDEIAGEYHEFGGPFDDLSPPFDLPGFRSLTIESLLDLMHDHGFEVSHRRHIAGYDKRLKPERLGIFFAKRRAQASHLSPTQGGNS